MRTRGHLFERLVDADFLDRAARLSVRGKRRRPDVAAFLFRRESMVRAVAAELAAARWRHGRFDLLLLHDPKPRVIARAGVEDRIVHTALALLVEEAVRGKLTNADFACRAGLGTHRALLRLLELARRFPFFVHLDVKCYFPSIDLEILRRLLDRHIRDRRFLAVLDRVLEAGRGIYDAPPVRRFARLDPDWPPRGRGLPIGAYTSQVLAAHVVPLGLDQHVLRVLRPGGYVRYVDDLFLFGASRARLRAARAGVEDYLGSELDLRLKHPRARVRSCRGRIDALGHRITRDGVEPHPRHARRLAQRAARWARDGALERALGRDVSTPIGWSGALGCHLIV